MFLCCVRSLVGASTLGNVCAVLRGYHPVLWVMYNSVEDTVQDWGCLVLWRNNINTVEDIQHCEGKLQALCGYWLYFKDVPKGGFLSSKGLLADEFSLVGLAAHLS